MPPPHTPGGGRGSELCHQMTQGGRGSKIDRKSVMYFWNGPNQCGKEKTDWIFFHQFFLIYEKVSIFS
jgi:hypothetical protein